MSNLRTPGSMEPSTFRLTPQGSKKNVNTSLSFEQAALTFCLPGATSFSSQLMVLLEEGLPGPSVSLKRYLASKKIDLFQPTGRDLSSSSSRRDNHK